MASKHPLRPAQCFEFDMSDLGQNLTLSLMSTKNNLRIEMT